MAILEFEIIHNTPLKRNGLTVATLYLFVRRGVSAAAPYRKSRLEGGSRADRKEEAKFKTI